MTDHNGYPWINPIGGYGDMLMVSGVLKLLVERDRAKRFNLVRRTQYAGLFRGHPAVAAIGYPPPGALITGTDYWAKETLGPEDGRPFQVLARALGLATPVEERLYLHGEGADPLLLDFVPWKKRNILIAPSSDSPRKMMDPNIWNCLVDLLLADGALVLQVGRMRDRHIRNAYSLLGLTSPRQAVALIRRCDLVVTSDNFLMHAAHLAGIPAVVVWGPTRHAVYGYPEQTHIQARKQCDLAPDEDCVGPTRNEGGRLYATPCPRGARHCLDQVTPENLFNAVMRTLAGK